MAIRIGSPSLNPSELVLIVEDDGGALFLDLVLRATPLAADEICIVRGRGWPGVHKEYDALLAIGMPPERIVPALDGDALGQKTAPSKLYQSPNLFRFYRDLELAFAMSECMMLDHAVLALRADFGPYGSPSALLRWSKIVSDARATAVRTRRPILDLVEEAAATASSNPAGLPAIPKPKLAETLARLCIATGVLPAGIQTLVAHVDAAARTLRGPSTSTSQWEGRSLWRAPRPPPTHGLQGSVLFTLGGIGLRVLDVGSGRSSEMPNASDIGWATWSPDGAKIGGVVSKRSAAGKTSKVVVVPANDANQRTYLTQGQQESFLCWHKTQDRCLVHIADGRNFMVSMDSLSWIEEPDDRQNCGQCITRSGRVARVPAQGGRYGAIEVARLGGGPVEASIPEVFDARHGLAWSHKGDRLAFINSDGERGSVCVWDRQRNRTAFLTPWVGTARFVAWSPDDSHVLFCVSDRTEAAGREHWICAIDAGAGASGSIRELIPLLGPISEPTLGCAAWKS